MEQELKPCPFCGGEAVRLTLGDEEPNNAGGDVITCTKCDASSHVEFGRKENLVSRWNLRTTQAPLIAAMREGVEALDAYTKMQVGAHDKALSALTNMRDTLAKIEGE